MALIIFKCVIIKKGTYTMSIENRKILKSQYAIKQAFIELMSIKNFDQITVQDISDKANVGRRTFYHHYLDKYDLLSKVIEEHINELKGICESTLDYNPNTTYKTDISWFKYFEDNYLFFSTMLKSKGEFAFRTHFLDFVIEELKYMVDFSDKKNKGLNEDIVMRFLGSAIVGVIEAYFIEGIPESSDELAEQVMILLDRNL